jgi:hypothetical protein
VFTDVPFFMVFSRFEVGWKSMVSFIGGQPPRKRCGSVRGYRLLAETTHQPSAEVKNQSEVTNPWTTNEPLDMNGNLKAFEMAYEPVLAE